jgi:hypothetical protein
MGNKLTYYVHDVSPENENFISKIRFKEFVPMMYIIGLEQIYKVNDLKLLYKYIEQRTDYIIAAKEEFLLFKNDKKDLVVKENFSGKELKYFLKKYGGVGRINDYYFFTPSNKYKIFVYDANTNTKIFDYNITIVFKFNLYTSYNFYILETE